MWQRTFLFAAFLSLTVLCTTNEFADAQKGGGGGKGAGGGGGKGGGPPPSMGKGGGGGMPKGAGGIPPGGGGTRYPGGYYGGGGYGGPGYGGFYGGGIILNFPLYGGYGYGAPYRYGYGGPLYYDDYPLGNMYYSPPQYVQPNYVQPEQQLPARYATIRVLLPDAGAKVWFDGNETKQTGVERYFYTPELDPAGGTYSYRIRAAWKEGEEPMVQERVVEVSPGKTAVADFR